MSSNFNTVAATSSTTTTTTTTTTLIDDSSPSLQQRRIEFHLARKPSSSSFSNNNNNNSNFKLEILNPSSSSSSSASTSTSSQPPPSSSSSNSKKSDSSEFFDASFDLDFGFRIPFRRIGAGLENLGNTCFLNSVIQCLTYTEPLVAYLQSGKHQNTCHVAGFCALCAMQKHVNCALKSTGRSLAPKDLVSNLRRISRTFRNARQEDAHEYMIYLLESMHKCCLPSGVPAESAGAYDKSLVHKIFGGRLRSQVKCLQCSHCSNTFDPFLDLSLEILKADSVHKALMNFTAAEQLDGGERQYKCEKCKQKVRALKQLTVSKAPYVLTIHLKRFRHFSGQKIDKKISFGSTLNLKQFVSGAYDGDLTYTLYGVLVHAGWSTHSGHYYCFVRTSSGIWYSLDDNRVYEVSEKKVMDQKAYMLFYVRDRKNVGTKKAMDAAHKENLFSTMRNASSPCSIPGVKSFQNGYVDKKAQEVIPSSQVTKQFEGHNASERLVEQKNSKCVPSNAIAMDDELNQKTSSTKENPPITNTNLDGMVNTATKLGDDNQSEKSDKATASSCPDNNREKDVASIEKPSISNCSFSVAIVPHSNDSQMAGTPTNVRNSLSNDGTPIIPSDSVIQPTTDFSTIKDGASEPVSDNGSVLSKPSIKRSRGSSLAKSSESTPHQRLMKDFLKSRVGGYLSTKMLYGASLTLRKNKKFKRMKKRLKGVMQEKLLTEKCAPADMGPSTSSSDPSGNFKHSLKEGHNTCDSVGENLGARKDFNDSWSKEPNPHLVNGDSVATRGLKDSAGDILGANYKDFKNSCSKEPNSQLVNGDSATTGGLKESAVGRWDGIEPPVKKVESNGRDTLTIGHVLDEWDEEYDRGKRKKVRVSRNSFGGPNVFQEVALKKAKLKVKKA